MSLNSGLMVGFFGLVIGIMLTYVLIPILQNMQMGQNIRTEGPKSHQKKAGTPSMGGVAIVVTIIFAVAIGGHFNKATVAIGIGFLAFALIGFIDDYLKVVKKQNEGLKPWQKFLMQLIVSVAFAIYIGYYSGLGTEVFIPFVKIYADFGVWFVPFIVFTLLAMTNGVNLTDGLDGLAGGVTAIVAVFMSAFASYLGLVSESCIFGAVAGACLGFLVFNKNPAKIFMGDTGSLALGGGIALTAIAMKMELLLPIVGLIYVLEAASVVLQVVYFKSTGGKRLFKMAPLHHHFEESGMKETAVVMMFWIITLICCLIGIFIA